MSRGKLVKRAALARFLEKTPEELVRMTREDGLPYVRIPGRTKPGMRFFLPDVHTWLLGYGKGECSRLADYPTFLEAFHEAQPNQEVPAEPPAAVLEKQ